MDIEERLSVRRIPEIPIKASRFLVTAPSLVSPDEKFDMNIAAIRIDGYPDTRFEGKVEIESSDEGADVEDNLSFKKGDHGTRRLAEVRMGTPGIHRIVVKLDGSALLGISNPVKCSEENREFNLYWGDIHVHNPSHSPEIPCIDIADSLDFAYRYSRHVSNVDFAAVTDHAYILDEEKWQITQQKSEEYNESGEFVTFLGYESSHRTENGGDENVYYLRDGEFMNFLPDEGSLSDLWQWLEDQGNEFMTIPHHTARILKARDWSTDYYGGPVAEPVYEIYSRWGASEFKGNPRAIWSGTSDDRTYFQDALARGYRFGVIAGSDDHETTPGRVCAIHYRFGGRWPNLRFPNGLAAIYAKSLTRKDLWEALRRRRCYGTSIDRVLVDFKVDGHLMGEEIQNENPEIAGEAYGTVPLVKVEVVKNGKVAHHLDLMESQPRGKTPGTKIARTTDVKFSFRDHVEAESYYYLRVTQRDGEMAWSSPIWVRP